MDITNILSLVLGPLIGLTIYLLGLRKVRAEARELDTRSQLNKANETDTFAEATTKFLANQEKLQERNTQLYNRVVELEKSVTDLERIKITLSERLTHRDEQINTLSNQLSIVQDKSRQSEITDALITQLSAITKISDEYRNIIAEREKTIKELRRTGALKERPNV